MCPAIIQDTNLRGWFNCVGTVAVTCDMWHNINRFMTWRRSPLIGEVELWVSHQATHCERGINLSFKQSANQSFHVAKFTALAIHPASRTSTCSMASGNWMDHVCSTFSCQHRPLWNIKIISDQTGKYALDKNVIVRVLFYQDWQRWKFAARTYYLCFQHPYINRVSFSSTRTVR